MREGPAESAPPPRTPTEVTEFNDRVWDMVLHLVHPVALFVVLQVVFASRFAGHEGVQGWSFPVYVLQFLGAWTVFYSTLLRDMGFVSRVGAVLCLWAAFVLGVSYVVAWDPYALSAFGARGLFAAMLLPLLPVWAYTLLRWRRLKARHGNDVEAPDPGDRS